MTTHIEALIIAAEEGDVIYPQVKIEICAECYGLKLTTRAGLLTAQRVIGWNQFREARAPAAYLLAVISDMRESITKASAR